MMNSVGRAKFFSEYKSRFSRLSDGLARQIVGARMICLLDEQEDEYIGHDCFVWIGSGSHSEGLMFISGYVPKATGRWGLPCDWYSWYLRCDKNRSNATRMAGSGKSCCSRTPP